MGEASNKIHKHHLARWRTASAGIFMPTLRYYALTLHSDDGVKSARFTKEQMKLAFVLKFEYNLNRDVRK